MGTGVGEGTGTGVGGAVGAGDGDGCAVKGAVAGIPCATADGAGVEDAPGWLEALPQPPARMAANARTARTR